MKCAFCKTDEKEVRYMLTKDEMCICDDCVILLSKKLLLKLKEDEEIMLNELSNM